MFTYYDRNGDQLLNEAELVDIERRDHLERLSRFCRLTDMLTFDDKEEDGNVSLSEFFVAFRELADRSGR
jgi:Ca2+-binding EF-hand superfamily protein